MRFIIDTAVKNNTTHYCLIVLFFIFSMGCSVVSNKLSTTGHTTHLAKSKKIIKISSRSSFWELPEHIQEKGATIDVRKVVSILNNSFGLLTAFNNNNVVEVVSDKNINNEIKWHDNYMIIVGYNISW